jgi:DNA-binding transcriptional LysR family regulator
MDQIEAMRVFVKIADTQSFRRAAQQLAVSNAHVTRSIALLETHLQTRLINRTTRSVALTAAGTRYLQGCRGVLEEFDHLNKLVVSATQEPGGTLNILAAEALSALSLTPLLEGYRRRYPQVNVRLTLAERSMEATNDGFESPYDVGIVTSAMMPNDELVQRSLSSTKLVMCAAPAYLAKYTEPLEPQELTSHSFVALQGGPQEAVRNFTDAAGKSQSVSLRTVYTVNSAFMVRQAALAGMGIAILPSQLVAEELDAGTLKRILQNHQIDHPDDLSIIYPRREFLPAKTSLFIDHTLEYFNGGKTAPIAASSYIPPYRYDLPED